MFETTLPSGLLTLLIPLVLVAALAGLARLATILLRSSGGSPLPAYRLTDSLLSKAEQSFFRVLTQAIGGAALVFAQVRLEDVIKLQRGLTPKARGQARGRIQQKHLDFVLCHPITFRPLGAIELDDKSHKRDRQKKRDHDKNFVAEAVGLPLIRIRAQRAYSVQDLRDQLLPIINAREPVETEPVDDTQALPATNLSSQNPHKSL
ncbi:DUF2726 domain-containing protein [Salinisphaera sp. P385]|uniref:DUF2726 domain-containing protein n=1 Tax=Spectribacter acetivorans TaxID=3075603 RepID=A0ABU3B7L0_9GAMM|nr:DUF2726 domain-containing protein [Salinisphaera sp. P385]MDT0618458.1 DUF2726 domain-containing protein [Salinisphaera sp. P385]